jgi:hypothetical protein
VILIRLFHFWTNNNEIHFSIMIDKVHFLTVPHFLLDEKHRRFRS